MLAPCTMSSVPPALNCACEACARKECSLARQNACSLLRMPVQAGSCASHCCVGRATSVSLARWHIEFPGVVTASLNLFYAKVLIDFSYDAFNELWGRVTARGDAPSEIYVVK